MTEYDDTAAAKFYADPANRAVSGEPLPRRSGRLSEHVPIRFRPETIELVKELAHDDGMTVSSWIRDVVEREVRRRTPRETQTTHLLNVAATISLGQDSQPRTSTHRELAAG